jgi:hypothetical protein
MKDVKVYIEELINEGIIAREVADQLLFKKGDVSRPKKERMANKV